jgi:hypothetical protein
MKKNHYQKTDSEQREELKRLGLERVSTCFFTYGGKILGHSYILEKSKQ